MLDAFYMLIGALFLAACWRFARACERL